MRGLQSKRRFICSDNINGIGQCLSTTNLMNFIFDTFQSSKLKFLLRFFPDVADTYGLYMF